MWSEQVQEASDKGKLLDGDDGEEDSTDEEQQSINGKGDKVELKTICTNDKSSEDRVQEEIMNDEYVAKSWRLLAITITLVGDCMELL